MDPVALIPPGTRGAISELLVATDLMKRGYHVFRALSPSCPCDLIVMDRSGKTTRIEVKTASRTKGGYHPQKVYEAKQDAVCHVMGDELMYVPPLEEW